MDEDSVLVSDNFPDRVVPELFRRPENCSDSESQEMEGDDLRHRGGGIRVVGNRSYYCESALPTLYSVCCSGKCSRHVLSVGQETQEEENDLQEEVSCEYSVSQFYCQ